MKEELTTNGIENSQFDPKKVLSGVEKLISSIKRNERKVSQYYVIEYNDDKDTYRLHRVYDSLKDAEDSFGLHIDETYNLFEPENYYINGIGLGDSRKSLFIVDYNDLKEFTLIDEDKLKYIPGKHEYYLYRVFILLKNLGYITIVSKSEVESLESVLSDCYSYYSTLSMPSIEQSNLVTASKLLDKLKLLFGNKEKVTLLIDRK